MSTRQEMWDRLGGQFDLLVVGGGVTGAGIARDASLRGLKVALVEARDFAFGTSSRSSKLVHGGLRYLEQGELGLVFEAVSERRILLDIAPHLVHPLPFLFPVFKTSRQPLWKVASGMWIYDGLSLFRSPKIHKTMNAAEVLKTEPTLREHDLVGAPLFYDCSTDDARLTLENVLDAGRTGATVVNRARVVGFLHERGRVVGATVKDEVTGATKEVRAYAVVNATGPWTDATLALDAEAGARGLLRPTKGVHIVVDAAKLPVKHAVVCFHPDDGRVLFAIPWREHTYLGTTDTDYDGDPADVHATQADVDYLVAASNHYFPGSVISRADVISTWAGLRPLMAPGGGEGVSESQVSREHQIVVGQDGLVTIAGGKLTTYRRMAAEVVDTALKMLRLADRLPARLDPADTDREPLPGAVGWPEDDDVSALVARVREIGGEPIADDVARHLVGVYGTRAIDLVRLVRRDAALGARLVSGRPEILAQVDWSVREELASEVDDVFVRRTQLFYRDHDQGLGAVEAVGRRMATLLGWDDARAASSMDAYRATVALSRRWREGDATVADTAAAV